MRTQNKKNLVTNLMGKKKPGPFLSARAIILNEDNRILLLKRSINDEFGDLWCLPGGKIDFGYTAKETIAKEVKEETSLINNSVKFLFYQDNIPTTTSKEHYITLYFECKVTGEIKLNNESSDFVWVDKLELNKYNIAFRNDDAIEKYWKDRNDIL